MNIKEVKLKDACAVLKTWAMAKWLVANAHAHTHTRVPQLSTRAGKHVSTFAHIKQKDVDI